MHCSFSAASMANSELSSVHRRSQRRFPPSPRASPWLVYQHGKDGKFQTFYNICDPKNNSYEKYIPELSNKRQIWQKPCHQGWLIILCHHTDQVSKHGDCFLWNPASLETIQLPNFLNCAPNGYEVKDCILCSPPQSSRSTSGSSGAGEDDSMVYILFGGGLQRDTLIYCHPGEKEWRKHEFVSIGQRYLQNMLYFKGKLYIMCTNGNNLEIEVQHGPDIVNVETLNTSDFVTTFGSSDSSEYELVGGWMSAPNDKHWIASFGEVFYIEKKFLARGDYQNCITKIIITKLDYSTMTWLEVKSLNDCVFFISDRVQLCGFASELGLTKGCVYFPLDQEMSLYKYDLEDDSIFLSLPCPDLPKPWLKPTWLMISTTDTDNVFQEGRDIDQVMKATEYNPGAGDKDHDKDYKDDDEESSAWVMLNDDDDMVWLISNYLHTLDYIHLRAVNRKYRSIMKLKRSASLSTTIQRTDLSPWLILAKYAKQVFNLVNPMNNNENYLMNFPESLKGARIRFSKGGWLLMSKGNTLFFYNPFSKSTIKLPDLDLPYSDSYHFSGIPFSSSPTSSDCVVLAVDKRVQSYLMILSIRRGDESWTYEEFDHIDLPPKRKHLEFELSFNNPVFYHEAFYCLGINGTLGVSKFEHGISWEILTTVAPPKCDFIYKSFLVECEGKLLSVLLGRLGKWVRVFRLDDTEMLWVEVKNLGKHMLFLSNTSSFSAIAPTGRQMENKIYFPRLHNKGILFYSLDTGMYHCIGSTHFATDHRDSEESLHCSWIEPNWLETADDHSFDWLN